VTVSDVQAWNPCIEGNQIKQGLHLQIQKHAQVSSSSSSSSLALSTVRGYFLAALPLRRHLCKKKCKKKIK
jgi:hypothetical protein